MLLKTINPMTDYIFLHPQFFKLKFITLTVFISFEMNWKQLKIAHDLDPEGVRKTHV